MIRSLSLKLAMLAVTMGVVFWITWQPGEPQHIVLEPTDNQLVDKRSSIGEEQFRATPAIQPAGDPIAVTPGVSSPVGAAGNAVSRLIDLNSATVDELISLPGLGVVLAQRVIDYRKSVGRFQAVEDLREVKGIGSKKFDQIKSLVTVARGTQKGQTEKRPS